MQASQFKSQARINQLFLSGNHCTAEQEQVLYEDPWYGLNDYAHYDHWQNLITTEDEDAKKLQMAFVWELRSYFGLSFSQVKEMQTNWNNFYNDEIQVVLNSIPSTEPYISEQGVAYWQWADSYMTRFKQAESQPSVANATNTVTGYVEFWYWL